MILLSEIEATARMSFRLACTAVEQALIAAVDGSGCVNPVLIAQGLKDGEAFSVKSGSARYRRVVGLKVGTYWAGNQVRGIPTHSSSILLLNPDTGRLEAVVEASSLNGLRTAAADAVAAAVLARPDSAILALIGAGHQAAHEARALCATLPIRRILIASSTRAPLLRDLLASELRIPVEVTNVENACREADVLVTVTPSRAPLFESNWLRPGVHVASMGSDQVGKQELPTDLLRSARLFCDLPSQSIEIGEFQHIKAEVQAGTIALIPIGHVLAGRAPGRRCAEEITVFDSSGIALQDLFVAASLLRPALEVSI
jgi:ornithine cyclodeaminase